MKRMIASMLVLAIVLTQIIPYTAALEMEDLLEPRNRYVYSINQIMSDSDYTIEYQVNPSNAIWEALFGNHSGSAFFGTDIYEIDYYKLVLTDIISPGAEIPKELSAATELLMFSSDFYELLSYECPKTMQEDVKKLIKDAIEDAELSTLLSSEDSIELVTGMLISTDLYLEGLRLVQEHEQDSNLGNAANFVYNSAFADSTEDRFRAYLSQITIDSFVNIPDLLLGMINGWIGLFRSGGNIAVGDTLEEEMKQMYYAQVQNAIRSTYYDLMDGRGFLNAVYSDDELRDMKYLATLYLHTAMVASKDTDSQRCKTCYKALEELLLMDTPAPSTSEIITGDEITIVDWTAPPSGLSEGSPYRIFGTIISPDSVLNEVKVEVLNDDLTPALKAAIAHPYSNTYQIGNLDGDVYIDRLQASKKYIFQVSATNDDGTELLINKEFTVHENRGIRIHGCHLPSRIKKGETYSICGLVSSDSPLSAVSALIVDERSNAIRYKAQNDEIVSNEYDLVHLDAQLLYNKLESGWYRYYVLVETSTGTSQILLNQEFQVYSSNDLTIERIDIGDAWDK